jgi:hypothetical protein
MDSTYSQQMLSIRSIYLRTVIKLLNIGDIGYINIDIDETMICLLRL